MDKDGSCETLERFAEHVEFLVGLKTPKLKLTWGDRVSVVEPTANAHWQGVSKCIIFLAQKAIPIST